MRAYDNLTMHTIHTYTRTHSYVQKTLTETKVMAERTSVLTEMQSIVKVSWSRPRVMWNHMSNYNCLGDVTSRLLFAKA